MTRRRKKKSSAGKVAGLIFAAAAGIILLVYFGGVYYFSGHYYFHTTIGSSDVSLQTPEYSTQRTTSVTESYLLTLYDRDGNKYLLRGPDFSYTYVPDGEEEDILASQDPFLWPMSLRSEFSYELSASVSYDSSQASDALLALDCFSDEESIAAPEDAYLVLGDEGYEIVPEVYGNTLIFDHVFEKVKDAFDAQATELTLDDSDYEQPAILSDDETIKSLTDQIDTFTNSVITYEIGDSTEVLSSTDIYKMLVIEESGEVTLDDDKITRFVQYLATTYNTYGDKRSFTTSLGDVLLVGGGDYGWVIAKSSEAAQLKEDLSGGVPVTREPLYEQTALEYGPDDIGDTYVEVDYTNQHLWYYKDGELVLESDFVSGNLSKGNGSPDGIFKIVYKKKDATLVGEDYESSVDYFMPFAYNVGFHDASWRSTFGGEIYRTKGSHGCINMPHDLAEQLYNELEVGTPVVAFYREEVTLTSENAKITNAASYVDPETLDTEEAD